MPRSIPGVPLARGAPGLASGGTVTIQHQVLDTQQPGGEA
jgi:hypothetical protein